MLVLYSFLSAVCVVISLTGLLSERWKWWKYILLMGWITTMAYAGSSIGHEMGIPMIIGALIMEWFLLDRNKIFNLFLSCIGYLICITSNSLILFIISIVTNYDIQKLAVDYAIIFSAIYAIVLFFILRGIRYVLYEKMGIMSILKDMSRALLSVVVNLFIYILIFIFNITMGEKIGYSREALLFNCILFFACMLSSSILLVKFIKKIETEEIRKREIHQQELREQYVKNLEYMVDELNSFRHDYKNILVSMAGYIREGNMKELQTYFENNIQNATLDIEKKNQVWADLRNIAPMEVKGFLYEKVLSALADGVKIQVSITEYIELKSDSLNDLIRVLGIFLDNAIEEVRDTGTGDVVVSIEKTKGIYFVIQNSCNKAVNVTQIFKEGYSTKGESRGNGLKWAKNIIAQHHNWYHECQSLNGSIRQSLEIM